MLGSQVKKTVALLAAARYMESCARLIISAISKYKNPELNLRKKLSVKGHYRTLGNMQYFMASRRPKTSEAGGK